MKIPRVLDSSGDRSLTFDDNPHNMHARVEAQELFECLINGGSTAFSVNRANGMPDQKVAEFSQLENETIVVPRMVGG